MAKEVKPTGKDVSNREKGTRLRTRRDNWSSAVDWSRAEFSSWPKRTVVQRLPKSRVRISIQKKSNLNDSSRSE